MPLMFRSSRYVATNDAYYEPISEHNDITVSYRFDENYPGYIEQFVAAYQYDLNGGITLCPIFNRCEYERFPEIYIVLADVDGDGKAELLTMRAIIYHPVTVYQFD